MKISHLSLRGIQIRLFLTCWVIFSLHFATNFVREHYLVLSIVDDGTFRLDPYVDLHVDIFETPDHGAHHGANPGASMIGAIPYFVLKPAVDWFVQKQTGVTDEGGGVPAEYKDDRPARIEFYRQVRERGLDIKFGLIGFITLLFVMAPLSALSAVIMFSVFGRLRFSRKTSIWLALLYALGTPVFFRTHYLNQNLMVGLFTFFAFVLLWQYAEQGRMKYWLRYGLAGFLSGLALLCDYSGLVSLFLVGGYALWLQKEVTSFRQGMRNVLWFSAGAVGPVLLLWFYQWRSFGHPLYPPQHYMPPVEWIEIGYQGVAGPSMELLSMLLFDPRFGLFTSSPILLLAVFAPILHFMGRNKIGLRETLFLFAMFLGILLFFSGVQYTRLQWLTGIRYMVPVIPFLFLLAAEVLTRLPRLLSYFLSVLAFTQSWCMSMASDDKIQKGVIETLKSIFLEGFQLPWLTTLYKMSSQYAPTLENTGVSPLPIFVFTGAVIYGIWRFAFPWEKGSVRRSEFAAQERQVVSVA